MLTRDYLHCFKRASGSANERASDMGQFIFKVSAKQLQSADRLYPGWTSLYLYVYLIKIHHIAHIHNFCVLQSDSKRFLPLYLIQGLFFKYSCQVSKRHMCLNPSLPFIYLSRINNILLGNFSKLTKIILHTWSSALYLSLSLLHPSSTRFFTAHCKILLPQRDLCRVL